LILWKDCSTAALSSLLVNNLKNIVEDVPNTVPFGKGFYFTDSSSYAASRSISNTPNDQESFLLLCEVNTRDLVEVDFEQTKSPNFGNTFGNYNGKVVKLNGNGGIKDYNISNLFGDNYPFPKIATESLEKLALIFKISNSSVSIICKFLF